MESRIILKIILDNAAFVRIEIHLRGKIALLFERPKEDKEKNNARIQKSTYGLSKIVRLTFSYFSLAGAHKSFRKERLLLQTSLNRLRRK